MALYNANAEKRIDDLIKESEKAEDSGIANQNLISASHILCNEFNHHPLDSIKTDGIRIKSQIRIYNKILAAYDEIVENQELKNSDLEDELSELKEVLRNI